MSPDPITTEDHEGQVIPNDDNLKIRVIMTHGPILGPASYQTIYQKWMKSWKIFQQNALKHLSVIQWIVTCRLLLWSPTFGLDIVLLLGDVLIEIILLWLR